MMKQIAPAPMQRQGMEQLEQRLDALLHDPIMPVPGYGVMAFDRGGLVYQRYGGLARIEPGAPGRRDAVRRGYPFPHRLHLKDILRTGGHAAL